MKYLIVSDIHGSEYYAKKIEQIINNCNFDKVINLGDIYYHGPRNPLTTDYYPMGVSRIFNKITDKLIMVKGNCDSAVDECISDFKFNDNVTLDIMGKKFYFTHGHEHNIDSYSDVDFDVMVYGHFHTGFIVEKGGKIFANPGSASLPKNGTENSYMVIDEADKTITIKNFDNKILFEKVVE